MHEQAQGTDRGFSLIELLVVILIIGTLAAIAVPVFIGQQDSAKDTQAISDLGLAKKALILWSTDNEGAYTTSLADLTDYGYSHTAVVTGTAINITVDDDRFCIQAQSDSGQLFRVTEDTTVAEGACS